MHGLKDCRIDCSSSEGKCNAEAVIRNRLHTGSVTNFSDSSFNIKSCRLALAACIITLKYEERIDRQVLENRSPTSKLTHAPVCAIPLQIFNILLTFETLQLP